MKKTIFALTTALALVSPSLTLEARAGNPFIEAQQRANQSQTKQDYNSQPQTQYKPVKNPFITAQEKTAPKPVQVYEAPKQEKQVVVYKDNFEGKLITLTNNTTRSIGKYISNANLEETLETIQTPVPQPPVPQEYPATQYSTQPQYATVQPEVCKRVQPMPEVCKPVQQTPMLIQGPPVVQAVPQTIYAPMVVIPTPTIVQPVAPVTVQYCRNLPFGGLFRGIGIGLRWVFAGPRHAQVYFPNSPYYNNYNTISRPGFIGVPPMNMGRGMIVPPMIGISPIRPGMPYAPRPFMQGQGMHNTPHQYRPFW